MLHESQCGLSAWTGVQCGFKVVGIMCQMSCSVTKVQLFVIDFCLSFLRASFGGYGLLLCSADIAFELCNFRSSDYQGSDK